MDNPDSTCAKGGHASYYQVLNFGVKFSTLLIKFQGISFTTDHSGSTRVAASSTMSYHTVLKSSKDYIGALKYARYIAENLTAILNQEGVEIFPYRFVVSVQLVNFYYC